MIRIVLQNMVDVTVGDAGLDQVLNRKVGGKSEIACNCERIKLKLDNTLLELALFQEIKLLQKEGNLKEWTESESTGRPKTCKDRRSTFTEGNVSEWTEITGGRHKNSEIRLSTASANDRISLRLAL